MRLKTDLMPLRQPRRVMRLFIRQVDGETLPLEACEQRTYGVLVYIYLIHPSLGGGRYEGIISNCNKTELVRGLGIFWILLLIYVHILYPLLYNLPWF